MNHPLLTKVDEIRAQAPAARRAILELILEDPDRVLEESFEQLAERAGSSVPTVMRTCRDLGFAGLRERELELAQAGEAEVAAGAHHGRHRAAGALGQRFEALLEHAVGVVEDQVEDRAACGGCAFARRGHVLQQALGHGRGIRSASPPRR